jgi:hypothetical protein
LVKYRFSACPRRKGTDRTAAAADGQRFLVKTLVSIDEATLNVIVNWEKAVPAKER